MKPLVVLVEDKVTEGRQIKEWIERDVPSVQVQWSLNTQDAAKVLTKYKEKGVVGCIVLDMFYRTPMGIEGFGQNIVDAYQDIPIIVISVDERAQYLQKPRDYVPLFRLEKPKNLFPVNNLRLEHQVQEFRRQLVEAIGCGLLIASLQAEIAQFKRKQILRPWLELRTIRAFIVFAFLVVFYIVSTFYFSAAIQHWIFGFCVLMAVHLLDQAILFKDIRDAVEPLRMDLVELAVKVDMVAEKTNSRDDQASQE